MNIVIIGGGTGTFTLLSGLKKFPTNNTVIVSSADDGGSTGILRKELGVMPPGDIRQCLLGLSVATEETKQLFSFRFHSGLLKGHSLGNIILAGLEKQLGIESAISLAGKILNVKGQVLPVTLKPTLLTAILNNGNKIVGEHNIDEPRKISNIKYQISKLQLTPNISANPKVIQAIKKADIIVFGPGDLYTSILPNLLPKGVKEALDKSKAKKVLISSIMTKPGQTDAFTAKEFVQVANQYLGKNKLNAVVVNNQKPSGKALALYKKTGAEYVDPIKSFPNTQVILANLISDQIHKKTKGDKLHRSLLRHNSNKLAKIIYQICKQN
jgi:uncharacterized cofD-like protein